MKIIKIKNSRGEVIDHDASQPIPDQHGIISSMLLMDSVQQGIAGSRVKISDADPDAAARQSYNDHKKYLADAWRSPPAPAAAQGNPSPATDLKDADSGSAYQQMVNRLGQAWRRA